MQKLIAVLVFLMVIVAAGMGWAEPYRILHKDGAIYNTDTGWNLNTPPYYPGNDWAVDLVADSEGVTILHKDGAMWNDTGGWDMSTPPYYPGSNYAQALDAGPEEVRMPISSLPYTITQSGSYYITGNLTAAGTGITVNADNVTIDLMGYRIIGPGTGTNYGIHANGYSNVEVRNGTLTNFGYHGVYLQYGNNHRVIEVRAVGNGYIGMSLPGYGNLVKDCTVSDNGSSGLTASDGSTVTGNTAYNNGNAGIYAVWGSTVTGNTTYDNNGDGIEAGAACTVANNTAYNNGADGIDAGNGCTVTGNTVYGNGGDGIAAGFGTTVRGNTARNSQYYGISLAGDSFVDGNTTYNNLSGGAYTNIEACATCTWGTNHNPAITP